MSDTHRENAILQAIELIADKKISQASFDKTIKAIIKRLDDKTIGKYIVRYQDSDFIAYANSPQVQYKIGEAVYILIPGNDWEKNKSIIGSVKNTVTTYKEIPASSELYNRIGVNLINLKQQGNISSYGATFENIDVQINASKAQRYIKEGDSIAIGMTVHTNLASSQAGGIYGLVFNLKFKESNGAEIIRSYIISSKDVIGNPYSLAKDSYVETLIKDINIQQFIGLDSVQIFCDGFPYDKEKFKYIQDEQGNKTLNPNAVYDIFITNINLFGAKALTESDLNGYLVHLDYSKTGNVLYTTEEQQNPLKQLQITAQLKVKGKTVLDNVEYYWFRENGNIFRGNNKYYGRAGEGWQCLNAYAGASPIPLRTGSFIFNGSGQDNPGESASLYQKTNKIKCIAVYENNVFSGECDLYNHIIKSDISIISSDLIDGKNKTVYYLDNGSPTLTCIVENNNKQFIYKWTEIPQQGRAKELQNNTINLASLKAEWERASAEFSLVAENDKQNYINSNPQYSNIKQQYQQYKNVPIINNNIYYNYPISSIVNSTKIICTVYDQQQYIGTASIVLYNRMQLQGMYSLSIENGVQVFQYDNKGNSPLSKHLDRTLEIKPLFFTLIDNQGKQISFEQIINNGYIKWLFPKKDTLLINNDNQNKKEEPFIGIDKELSEQFEIFDNISSFSYSIAEKYDLKKNQNNIKLLVKYKDIILQAYTDFTFPKEGDPGTNGTDFIAKLFISGSDRVYVNNNDIIYDDTGANIQGQNTSDKKINFAFYNNSIDITDNVSYINWNCPIKRKDNHYFSITSTGTITGINKLNSLTEQTIDDKINKYFLTIENKPVDIIRATYSPKVEYEKDRINYYAEYPVNYTYTNDIYHRIKIRPKSGFKYVVYSQDGTRPDYDNTLPFEVMLEQLINGQYYIQNKSDELSYEWYSIGNLQIENINGRYCTVKPLDNFDGKDLSSAIICKISKNDQPIGFIHIPIYMILNRYGHQALNDWDGNSIQINEEGNVILAPQIGAGVKNSDDQDNSFTGIFMGAINGLEEGESEQNRNRGIDSDDYKIGLAGYHNGARTIFLDSKTGKAQFGKNNAGRIILDPSTSINKKDTALIYSGNYPISTFIEKQDVELVGNQTFNEQGQLDPKGSRREQGGMIIDLSTPQIGFGSGNFTVNSKGHLVAKGGGEIAGWSITDISLSKNNTGMASQNQIFIRPDNQQDTKAFYSTENFYATHKGYLFSKLGQIAGWNIDSNKLNKDKVGMNSNPSYYGDDNKSLKGEDGKAKAFFANDDNFYVTHNGYLRSTSGKIASWNIDDSSLTNGNVGMGSKIINSSRFGTTLTAKFWAGNGNNNENFAVTAAGELFSRDGKIGGWKITDKTLQAGKIIIDSSGSISATNGTNSWSISNTGRASFNYGQIGTVTIDENGLDGGSWWIRKGNIHLPGLKITKQGDIYITQNGSSGGGSASGLSTAAGGFGSTGKTDWMDLDDTKSDSKGSSSVWSEAWTRINNLFFENGAGKRLVSQQFSVYGSVQRNTKTKGPSCSNLLLAVNDSGSSFSKKVLFKGGIRCDDDNTKGLSGALKFSNGAYMRFRYGIFVNFTKGDDQITKIS